jgi:hypothetical protein
VRWRRNEIRAWLASTETANPPYVHTLLAEESTERAQGLAALGELAQEAHDDARRRVERLLAISLDPLERDRPLQWPAYPDSLHTTVLQGYLGELLAGVIAETYDPHGRTWSVPAFLFRGHAAAFQDIERRRQLGGPARPIPGRTGDDAFAFEMNEDDEVTAWLWGEAKCTYDHSSTLIADGHAQLSIPIQLPVDLLQLIEVLSESQLPDADRWIAAIREMIRRPDPPPRFDMFVYVCGRKPVRNPTWISSEAPHSRYGAAGPLQAIEVHLDEFDDVMIAVYPRHVVNRA